MGSFDKYYNFRLATIKDVDFIMQFFREGWGRYNVIANERDFLLWMYGRHEYGDDHNINFVIMESKDGDIVGCIGYVPYSNEKEFLHISPAMTLIKDTGMRPLSGVELMRRQMQLVGEKAHFSFGTNPKTILPIYDKVFHHETGVIQQFYMLNPKVDEYRIADIKDKILFKPTPSDFILSEFKDFAEVSQWSIDNKELDRLPYKSPEYIRKRYFDHPVYNYRKWIVKEYPQDTIEAILFGRVVGLFGHKILRIVDYRGNIENIKYLGYPLSKIMEKEGFEYIDWIMISLPEAFMNEAGFALLDHDGDNIVPNYFEPYIRENIKLYYQKNKDILVFKADGDQDRPNRI